MPDTTPNAPLRPERTTQNGDINEQTPGHPPSRAPSSLVLSLCMTMSTGSKGVPRAAAASCQVRPTASAPPPGHSPPRQFSRRESPCAPALRTLPARQSHIRRIAACGQTRVKSEGQRQERRSKPPQAPARRSRKHVPATAPRQLLEPESADHFVTASRPRCPQYSSEQRSTGSYQQRSAEDPRDSVQLSRP